MCHQDGFLLLQTVIIENAADSSSEGYIEGFDGNGYISLAIAYVSGTICDWLAPSTRALLGLKLTFALGALTYAFFISTFYTLSKELLYAASASIGLGSALLRVSQVPSFSLKCDQG